MSLKNSGQDFVEYIWSFAPADKYAYAVGRTITCPESDAMAKALKKLGFAFCSSTICHAFMQACGMVDDYSEDYFRYSKKD